MNTFDILLLGKTYRIILAVVLIFVIYGCNPRYGFIESEFQLAPESRLPRWIELPSGYAREDLTITFTIYTHPFLNPVEVLVRGPAPEDKILMEKIGTKRYLPSRDQQKYDEYPKYIIFSINGVEEGFEQRRPDHFLYITDDPKIR